MDRVSLMIMWEFGSCSVGCGALMSDFQTLSHSIFDYIGNSAAGSQGCIKLLITARFCCTVLLQRYLMVCSSAAVGRHTIMLPVA